MLLFDLYCAGDVTTIVRKRKNSRKDTAKLMREKKAQKRHEMWLELEEEPDASVDMDNSIVLPAPSITVSNQLDDNLDLDDKDYINEITAEDIPLLYMDWINETDREDVQMFAMMLYDIFVERLKVCTCSLQGLKSFKNLIH